MAYIVTIDDKKYKVDIKKEDNNFQVFLDGKLVETSITEINSHSHFSLIVDNKSYDIAIENDDISVDGETFKVKVEDERFVGLALKKQSVEGGKTAVKAPIPGLVVELLVKEGDKIKANDGLVILEAMKMQNELKAPRDGVVKQIFIAQGMPVNGGDTRVVIE